MMGAIWGAALGVLVLVGLLATARAIRRGRRLHHGRHGCHGHGGHGRFGRFRRRAMRRLFHRLDTSPGQERTILEAVSSVKKTVFESRESFAESRAELARSIAGDYFDESALFAAFAKHDQALAKIRGEIGEALARVHEVLTLEQRTELATMVAHGPLRGGFGGGFGGDASGPTATA